MQKHWNKIEPLTFYALLALWLVPIWYVAFFVTGDGPCHLHNSKILLDWWSGENKALYEQYYTLNPHVDPNWLFNLLTVPLLAIFKPALAEKIYLTMYVLGFGLGFRFMLRQINPNSLFLSSVALLFCQHRLFMMGFCNNSLSFALWFWVAGWWWKNRNDFSAKALLITTLLWFVLYLAHPMGLAFAGMMVVCMAVGLFLFELKEEGFSVSIQKSIRRAYTSILCALPTLLMTYNFIPRRSWSEETNKPNVVDALENIERLSSLNVLNHVEQDLASLVALLCFGFFIAALMLRINKWRWHIADGLFLFCGVAFYCILYPPNSISGGLEVPMRMVMVPFLAGLAWMSTADFGQKAKWAAIVLAVVLSISMLRLRLPAHRNASDLAVEVFSAKAYLPSGSRIMVLNYDYTGRTPEGEKIADAIWLFGHVDCYIGAEHSVILSDNYEANFWYFPVMTRWETSLSKHTEQEGLGMYNMPPRVNLLGYKAKTGQDIDYVLMVNYPGEHKEHEFVKETLVQLDQAYEKIYTSEHGRAVVFKERR